MASVEKPARRGTVKPADVLAGAGVACAALIVFRGAAAYGFAQDDFAALGRAAGLLPRFTAPWRWLALQGFFDVMRPLAGLDALPYHLVSLAGHALAAVMVFRLLLRFAGRAAAFAGAAGFATHAASFTAVYWISTVGDLWALVFALVALEWSGRGRAGAVVAPLAFALALLCKESVLLLPLVIMAWRGLDGRRTAPGAHRRLLDPGLIAMGFLAAAYGVYFTISNRLAAAPAPGAEPYSLGAGRHLVDNALTYLGWTLNAWLPTVRGWSDAIDPPVFAWGAGLALAWGLLAWVPSLRRRGWLHAGILYAALIAPVLPLEHHTYHYYLYAALAGAALAFALLLDQAVDWMAGGAPPATRARRGGSDPRAAAVRTATRATRRRVAIAGSLAALAAVAFTVNGALLVRKIETQPFGHPDLRAAPIVDRALIAARVRAGLAAARLPAGVTLYFYSPEARAMAPAGDSARPTYWERNVRSALYDGLAVRLFAPAVAEVRFVTRPVVPDSAWIAVYDVAGRTRVVHATASTAEPPGH